MLAVPVLDGHDLMLIHVYDEPAERAELQPLKACLRKARDLIMQCCYKGTELHVHSVLSVVIDYGGFGEVKVAGISL